MMVILGGKDSIGLLEGSVKLKEGNGVPDQAGPEVCRTCTKIEIMNSLLIYKIFLGPLS